MADLADVSDVETAWRPLTDSQEYARVAFLLRRVSALIRHHVPTVDGRLAAGTLSDDLVRGVAVDAVVRVLENPHGVVARTQSVEDYSETERYADAAAQGLHLTPAELTLLQGVPVSASARGAFTIRPGAGGPVRWADGSWPA